MLEKVFQFFVSNVCLSGMHETGDRLSSRYDPCCYGLPRDARSKFSRLGLNFAVIEVTCFVFVLRPQQLTITITVSSLTIPTSNQDLQYILDIVVTPKVTLKVTARSGNYIALIRFLDKSFSQSTVSCKRHL